MDNFWTSTLSNTLGGLISGFAILLVAGGFGLLVAGHLNRPNPLADRRAATLFNVTGVASSVMLVAFLIVGQSTGESAWLWAWLALIALVIGLDVILYTRAAAAWVATSRRKDDEARRRLEALARVGPQRRPIARGAVPRRRARRLAGRKRHVGGPWSQSGHLRGDGASAAKR